MEGNSHKTLSDGILIQSEWEGCHS